MIDNLTVIVPYRNGQATIERLLASLPAGLPVIVVDDQSSTPYQTRRANVKVLRPERRGYFAGAVNAGMMACSTDALIINQDVWFEGEGWQNVITEARGYGIAGDGVFGHPAWPGGYVQGTFMYISRAVIEAVGGMNEIDYPLWGATAEYQARVCRAGFRALPLADIPGMRHERRRERSYGAAITAALQDEPDKKGLFIRTPPAVSVIVPCYNYGRYLPDLIASLIGGKSCLGQMAGQTFQSFEVVIVDDASTDGETPEIIAGLADAAKGIRAVYLPRNQGTAAANNAGIRASYGQAITILGADDMMESDRLEKMYRAWVMYPDRVIYDDIQLVVGTRRAGVMQMREYDFEECLYRNQMHAGIMFGRAAWVDVGGYPEAMRYGREDWAFNIALGIKGYCGMRVPGTGYLYRKGDGHNRTERTRGEVWRARFLEQMQELYPQIYAGGRPIMCCGARKAKGVTMQVQQNRNQKSVAGLPGAAGLITIEYLGGNVGTMSYYGAVTGTRYEAGKKRSVIWIDERDATTGDMRKPGMLEIREGGQYTFRLYSYPEAEPVKATAETEAVDSAETVELTAAAKPVRSKRSRK